MNISDTQDAFGADIDRFHEKLGNSADRPVEVVSIGIRIIGP